VITVEGVGSSFVATPLIQGEGRIRHNDVEAHEVVTLDKAGIPQGVAPLDAEVIHAMQEHVHAAEGVGSAVHLLTEEGEVALIGLAADLNKEGSRAAGGITDGIALLRSKQEGKELGDLARRIKFSRFFACVGCESLEEVFVDIPNDIFLSDDGGTEVEAWISKILKDELQAYIPIAGLAELGLGVEIDLAEDSLELALISLFDAGECDIHPLADVGLIAMGVETVEVAPLGQLEALAGQASGNACLVTLVFPQVGIPMIAPDVGHVFPEEHHEDVVPVVLGIDDATEGIAGFPGDIVDFRLVCGGHREVWFLG